MKAVVLQKLSAAAERAASYGARPFFSSCHRRTSAGKSVWRASWSVGSIGAMRDPFRPGSFLGLIVLWPIIAVIVAVWYGIAALIQWLTGN